jgi:hypothetical protein
MIATVQMVDFLISFRWKSRSAETFRRWYPAFRSKTENEGCMTGIAPGI